MLRESPGMSSQLTYLAWGDGKVVNQAKWIDTINRGEEDLGLDCVTIMLEKKLRSC